MSYQLTAQVIEAAPPGLTPVERLVLLAIAHFQNSVTDECWASNETLAKVTGTAESNVSKVITSLINKGLVDRADGRRGRHLKINILGVTPKTKIHILGVTPICSRRDTEDLGDTPRDLGDTPTELRTNKELNEEGTRARLSPRPEGVSMRPVPGDRPLSGPVLADYLASDVMRRIRSRGGKPVGNCNRAALARQINNIRLDWDLSDTMLLHMMDVYGESEWLWPRGQYHPAMAFTSGATMNALRNICDPEGVAPTVTPVEWVEDSLAARRVRERTSNG